MEAFLIYWLGVGATATYLSDQKVKPSVPLIISWSLLWPVMVFISLVVFIFYGDEG